MDPADVSALLQEVNEENSEEELVQQLVPKFSPSENIPEAELEGLYGITGYTIFCVMKTSKLCSACKSAMVGTYAEVSDTGFADLCNLNDYTGHALKYCNKGLFDNLFKPMESYFRQFEGHHFGQGKNLAKTAIDELMKSTGKVLPTCHDAKLKLVKKFVHFRLKLSAGFTLAMTEDAKKLEKSGRERGSRSMTMKKVVQEIK